MTITLGLETTDSSSKKADAQKHQQIRKDVRKSLRKVTNKQSWSPKAETVDGVVDEADNSRPTLIHDRLKWLDLDAVTQVAMGSRHREGGVKDAMLVHFAATAQQTSATKTCSGGLAHPIRTAHALAKQLQKTYDYFGGLMFTWFLSNVEHKHGHGVAEVMNLAKFLLGLNFKLGLIWLGFVILPREYVTYTRTDMYVKICCLLCIYMPAIDRSLSDCRYTLRTPRVFLKLFLVDDDDSDEGSSLYYDSFERTMRFGEGSWIKDTFDMENLNIDVLYLVALTVAMAVSFIRVLVLGAVSGSPDSLEASLSVLIPPTGMGESAKEENTHGDDGVSWHSLLGDYDFTRQSEKSAIKMRQVIRRRIDDWEFDKRETADVQHSSRSGWQQRLTSAKEYTGSIFYGLLLFFYAFGLYLIYRDWETFEKVWGTLPSVCINGLLLLCEEVMSIITEAEQCTSAQRQKNFVHRTFYLKVFTMFSMFLNQVKIMSADYDDFMPNITAATQAVATTFDSIADQVSFVYLHKTTTT